MLNLHEYIGTSAEIIKALGAVYWTVGSRGNDLLRTDALSAVKLMHASERVV